MIEIDLEIRFLDPPLQYKTTLQDTGVKGDSAETWHRSKHSKSPSPPPLSAGNGSSFFNQFLCTHETGVDTLPVRSLPVEFPASNTLPETFAHVYGSLGDSTLNLSSRDLL